jgi:hypothetical protein
MGEYNITCIETQIKLLRFVFFTGATSRAGTTYPAFISVTPHLTLSNYYRAELEDIKGR